MRQDDVDDFFVSVGARRTGRAPRSVMGDAVFLRAFGRRLQAARLKLRMTQRMLAEETGVSVRYISLAETGAGNVSLRVLRTLADSLAVDALDLLEDRLDSPLHRLADRLDAAQRDEAHRVLVRHFARATEGARRIALIGLPDSGLVALGEGLAAALALRFVAFDAAMAAAGVGAGVGAGEVFQRFSHAGVQRLQRRVLEQSLAGAEGVVLAVGVAVAASPRTWAAVLRSCRTIWLRVSSETIIRREQARLGATRRRDLRAVLAAQTAMLGRADAILDIEGRGEAEILAALIGLAAG